MKRKLLSIMCGLVAFVVLFGFAQNSLLLERFYVMQKSRVLLRSMHEVSRMYSGQSDDTDMDLLRMQIEQGMQIIVFGSNLEIRYLTVQQQSGLPLIRRNFMGGIDLVGFIQRQAHDDSLSYEISRNYDGQMRMEYLDLVGNLDNGDYVLMRMPIQTITDSVDIANRFLIITGAVSLLISVFFSFRFSSQITKPIQAVEDIARSMSNLDFSRKIAVRTKDEIGSLGASINMLSDQLQSTIEELQQKNRQLEEDILYISRVDESRKEFLASVSHELKTPIALIRGYAEALEERVVTSDESRDYYYHVISDEAEKMNTLVKKLMSLNNLEAGHDELYMSEVNVVSLLQSVLDRCRTLPGAEGLDFVMQGSEEAYAMADDFYIEEVAFNYITNAINHVSGRNLVRITVSYVPYATEAGRVRVEVFNSGSHLEDEERERVWESFYKADKSRSREYGGSGLGLSVVRAIIERHHGSYGVENVEDGVSFWFELDC